MNLDLLYLYAIPFFISISNFTKICRYIFS